MKRDGAKVFNVSPIAAIGAGGGPAKSRPALFRGGGRVAALALCAVLAVPSGCGGGMERYSAERIGPFDTITQLIAYADNQREFDAWAEVFFARYEELHRYYDIFNEYEGVSNLCTVNKRAADAPVAVPREVTELLLLAKQGCEMTGGAFNAALGPVTAIWREYREQGAALPPGEALRLAAEYADMDDVVIDEAASTVYFRKRGMSLDVGAIAKSHAASLAAAEAADAGMASALINAGGNIIALAPPAERSRRDWAVGIQNPDPAAGNALIDTIYISRNTVSVSGGYQRYYTVNGESYHHIIDPDTLMPASRFAQAAVAHEEAWKADVLSTALFILPFEAGAALAEQHGAKAFWVDARGKTFDANGFDALRSGK
ncbi:MAG: FAD:protein FMN transferase [Oscillospiraceae bacterium]|jgi:thiamine biosynthesis lipoprotein|nr:FAD:protein FMN transferase [Oscillospiraceae bacterium]